MVTTLGTIEGNLAQRFKDAVAKKYNGNPYGHIAAECREAIENHIKLLEGTK